MADDDDVRRRDHKVHLDSWTDWVVWLAAGPPSAFSAIGCCLFCPCLFHRACAGYVPRSLAVGDDAFVVEPLLIGFCDNGPQRLLFDDVEAVVVEQHAAGSCAPCALDNMSVTAACCAPVCAAGGGCCGHEPLLAARTAAGLAVRVRARPGQRGLVFSPADPAPLVQAMCAAAALRDRLQTRAGDEGEGDGGAASGRQALAQQEAGYDARSSSSAADRALDMAAAAPSRPSPDETCVIL